MNSVYDIADYIIKLGNSNIFPGDNVTNLRLNKLLFFVQLEHLKRTGKPLFNEKFEAWDYGPVLPVIYNKYKAYGSNAIDTYNVVDTLADDVVHLIIDVYFALIGVSTGGLVTKSNKLDTPWHNIQPDKQSIIDIEDMKEWADTQTIVPDTRSLFDVVVPEYTADGKPIFPAEWEDDFE